MYVRGFYTAVLYKFTFTYLLTMFLMLLVRSMPSERYLFTLCDKHTSRIRCVVCHRSSTGRLRIATGGQQLKLWSETTTTDFEHPVYVIRRFINQSFNQFNSNLAAREPDSK